MKKYKVVALPKRFEGGDGGGTYTVKDGDTFRGIANRLRIPYKDLEKANPGINYDAITIGQVLNVPEKKTVVKSATKVAEKVGVTPGLRELLQSATNATDEEVYEDYFNNLKFQENSVNEGLKDGLYYPYVAVEDKNKKNPTYDIGFGNKLTPKQVLEFSEGVTEAKAIDMMKSAFEEKKKYAAKYIDEEYGKGTFKKLDPASQVILTDYQYNVRGGISTFKNFAKGVVNKDKDLMLKEYVRYSGKKPLGQRNKFTKDWINKYYEDTPKEQDGGFVEIDLSEEDALEYAQNGYIVEEIQNYDRGGVVSSIWKERTGTPWSEAKAQGLTDGSYDKNIALRKRLLQGEFDSESFKSTPTEEREKQKAFDYAVYDKRVRDRVAKGQTLDDLVKRRLGTRQGLTARFPDLFEENQAVEVADLTDKEAEELKEQGYTLEETTDKTPTTVDWNTPLHQLKMTLLKNKNFKVKSFDDIYEESLKPKGLTFDLDSDKEVGSIQPTFKMNLPEYKRSSSYDPSKSFSENYNEFTKYKGLSFDLRSEEEKQIAKDARQKVEDEINALQQKEEESKKAKAATKVLSKNIEKIIPIDEASGVASSAAQRINSGVPIDAYASQENIVSEDKYGPELMALLNRANQTTQEETSPVYVDPITGRKSRDRSVRKLVNTPVMDAAADAFVRAGKTAGEYVDAASGLPKKIYEGVSEEVEDLVDKFQKTSILPGKITNDVELLYKAGSAIVNKDYEALLETKYGQDIGLKILDQNENPNKYYDLKFKTLTEEEQQWLRRKLEKEGRINTPDEQLKVKEEKLVKETPKPEAFIERIGDVKDSYDKKYKLLSYRNQWDNNEGFVYRTAPTKQHRKNSDVYKDVLGVAHFLLDASVDPRNPYSHRNNETYIRTAKANDEWIPAFENVSDNEVRLKYKKPKDILETDIVSAPLRQLKFSDINFNSSQTPKGFRSTVNEVTTKDGDGTYLLFKSRNGYSRFSGGSVVFIFEDKYGNSIVRDFAGSLNTIKKEGDSIQKQYKLKPGELTIGYHDVGSFSAKPKADDNNVLRADQWKGYNNNGYTGGALLIPSKR